MKNYRVSVFSEVQGQRFCTRASTVKASNAFSAVMIMVKFLAVAIPGNTYFVGTTNYGEYRGPGFLVRAIPVRCVN